MIEGEKLFDQPVNNDLIIYENIRKVATVQGDDDTTGCLLDYNYFEIYYQMIAVGLSKQQTLDPNPKVIQQINYTANLERDRNTTTFFIIEEAKENVLDFSQETVKIL